MKSLFVDILIEKTKKDIRELASNEFNTEKNKTKLSELYENLNEGNISNTTEILHKFSPIYPTDYILPFLFSSIQLIGMISCIIPLFLKVDGGWIGVDRLLPIVVSIIFCMMTIIYTNISAILFILENKSVEDKYKKYDWFDIYDILIKETFGDACAILYNFALFYNRHTLMGIVVITTISTLFLLALNNIIINILCCLITATSIEIMLFLGFRMISNKN